MSDWRYYTLAPDGQTPVGTNDPLEWGRTRDRDMRVALDEFDGVRVSTVFLGLDHRFVGDGPPVLWETMIFGGPLDQFQCRYTSRAAAEGGHAVAVALAQDVRSTGGVVEVSTGLHHAEQAVTQHDRAVLVRSGPAHEED